MPLDTKIQKFELNGKIYDFVVPKSWTQMDSTAVDYIENRTHYTKPRLSKYNLPLQMVLPAGTSLSAYYDLSPIFPMGLDNRDKSGALPNDLILIETEEDDDTAAPLAPTRVASSKHGISKLLRIGSADDTLTFTYTISEGKIYNAKIQAQSRDNNTWVLRSGVECTWTEGGVEHTEQISGAKLKYPLKITAVEVIPLSTAYLPIDGETLRITEDDKIALARTGQTNLCLAGELTGYSSNVYTLKLGNYEDIPRIFELEYKKLFPNSTLTKSDFDLNQAVTMEVTSDQEVIAIQLYFTSAAADKEELSTKTGEASNNTISQGSNYRWRMTLSTANAVYKHIFEGLCFKSNFHTKFVSSGNKLELDTDDLLFIIGGYPHRLRNMTNLPVIAGKGSFALVGNQVEGYNRAEAADGNYSAAFGYDTVAGDDYTFAAGQSAKAQANHSVAFGFNTVVTGSFGLAAGYESAAKSSKSVAFGEGTTADGVAQLAVGRYNSKSEYAYFVVGVGDSDAQRSSAFEVQRNGTIVHNQLKVDRISNKSDGAIQYPSAITISGDTAIPHKKYVDDQVAELSATIGNLTNIMNFRGVFATTNTCTDPKPGDVIVAQDTGYEYVYVNNAWEEIGNSSANLARITAIETSLADGGATYEYIEGAHTKVDNHTADKANPHSVTKAQVGLGNVDNKSEATIKADFTGSIDKDDDKFVLGKDVYSAIQTIKGTAFNKDMTELEDAQTAHADDKANPHSVKASQLYASGVSDALGSIADSNTGLITGGAAYTAIQEAVQSVKGNGGGTIKQVETDLATHVSSTSNPHNVKASQLYASGTVTDAIGSVAANNKGLVRGGTVYTAVNNVLGTSSDASTETTVYGVKAALTAHTSATNPHGITADSLGVGAFKNKSIATSISANNTGLATSGSVYTAESALKAELRGENCPDNVTLASLSEIIQALENRISELEARATVPSPTAEGQTLVAVKEDDQLTWQVLDPTTT